MVGFIRLEMNSKPLADLFMTISIDIYAIN